MKIRILVHYNIISLLLMLPIQALSQVTPTSPETQLSKTELEKAEEKMDKAAEELREAQKKDEEAKAEFWKEKNKGLIDSTEEKNLKRFYAAVNGAEIMDTADSFSVVIARVKIEEVVEALSDKNGRVRAASRDYVKVRLKDGRQGWILESMLSDEISATSAQEASVRPGSGSQSAGAGASGIVGYNDYSDLKLFEPDDIRATSTGRTTGHIADVNLNNTDSNPVNFTIPASEIPGDGVYQSYVIPTDTTFIIPGNTIMDVPVTGFCTNPNLAPRPSGTEFPPMTSWNTSSTLIPTLREIIEVATDLQKDGTFQTPFSNQPDVEQKVIIQNTFWRYTTPDYNPCSNFKMRYETYTGIPQEQMKATDKAALDYGIGQVVVAIDRTTYGLKKIPHELFSHSDQLSQFYRLKDALPSNYPEIAKTIHVTGTGRTTGHIANLTVTNPTDKLVKIQIGSGSESNSNNPFYIPSDGQYQPYIVPTIPPISVSPGQTEIIELSGFCTDISTPPVPTGVEMPHPSQWIGLPGTQVIKTDPNVVTIPTRSGLPMNELVNIIQNIQTNDLLFGKDCPKIPTISYPILPGTNQTLNFPIDVEKYPAVGVPLLLDAISKIATEYDQLKAKGIINTPFSGNPEKEREAVIQQTFWRYSSVLEGGPYGKKDFRANTIRQFEQSSGKQFDQQPQPQQQKLIQGVDDFWNTFEAVGTEAKILSRPPEVPKTPVPDDFWNDLPMKSTSNTQPELIGDKKGKPVAGPAKNNKKTEKKCECGDVTFSLMLWDAVANPPGSEKYSGKDGTYKKKEIKSGGSSALPEENISLKKNLKKGSKQLVDIRNLKVNCPCINQTDEIVKATKELETLKTDAKRKIEEAEKNLIQLEKDLIEAEKKLAEEKSRKRPNQNTVKTRQDKVTELQNKITELRNNLETLNKPIKEKQSEIDALKSKNHEATDCPVYGDKTKSSKLPDVKVNEKETKVYNNPDAPSEDTRTIVVDVLKDNSLEFTIDIKFYCEGPDCKPVECARKFKVKVDNEK